MNRKILVATALITIGVTIPGGYTASAATTITKVYDGDTITLSTGEKVRLLQIDTPELTPAECYGKEARAALVTLLSTPGQLSLKTDPKLDKVDWYGRLLRYLFIGKTNINLKLVELGAAAPYFYRGDKGQYSSQILKAATNAKAKSLGLWKRCPGTQLTPNAAVTTIGTASTPVATSKSSVTSYDLNYPGCIPVFPPDVGWMDKYLEKWDQFM